MNEHVSLTHGIRVLVASTDDIGYSAILQQLDSEGYLITRSRSSEEVLALIQDEQFSIILAEQNLPGFSGTDLFNRIQSSYSDIARILICENVPSKTLAAGIASGTFLQFLTRPWSREEILVTVRTASLYNRLSAQNRTLAEQNMLLSMQLVRSPSTKPPHQQSSIQTDSADTLDGSIGLDTPRSNVGLESCLDAGLAHQAFTKTLYTFHPDLGNTALRTKALCEALCGVLDMSPSEAKSLLSAALLHDIGLIGIDRELVRRWLRNPEKCSDAELDVLEKHPDYSQRMLRDFDFLQPAAEVIRAHHENWDGSGYPDGLRKDTIPWLSRLLRVAIAYSTKYVPSVVAIAQIEEEAERKFDPAAIRAVSKAAAFARLPQGEREILLIELKQGMTLAEDIYNGYGFLLLPKGSKMTETLVGKVWAANRSAPIDPYILVFS